MWLLKPDRTKTVDNEFLLYLESERARLAKMLVQDNPNVRWGEHGLNEAVQQIIDRVLFQRVCQDRNINIFKKLEISLHEWRDFGQPKGGLWHLLVNNFRSMAAAFNGGLYGRKGQPPHSVDALHVRDAWLAGFVEEISAERIHHTSSAHCRSRSSAPCMSGSSGLSSNRTGRSCRSPKSGGLEASIILRRILSGK